MRKKSKTAFAIYSLRRSVIFMKEKAMEATMLKVESKKSQARNIFFGLFIFAGLCGLCSCSVVSPYGGLQREEPPYNEELSTTYDRTQLNKSITLDVLPVLQNSPHDLLSQSDSTVAASGQSKKGYKTWFNMVAFDEYKLTAKRKYFFVVDEKIARLPTKYGYVLFEPKRGLAFDCEMAFEKEVLDKPYPTESAKQLEILKEVSKNLHSDIDELGEDIEAPGHNNRMLNVCGMLLNQTFQMILPALETSSALTTKLSDKSGIEFDHINFDKGRIQMVIADDIVRVKIRLGALADTLGQ